MTQLLNLKERYPFECFCGFSSEEVQPSSFMSGFQINIGGVDCPQCKKRISVRLNDTNDRLVAVSIVPERFSPKPLPEACYRDATPDEEEAIANRMKGIRIPENDETPL